MSDDNVFRIQIETTPEQQEKLPAGKDSPEQSHVEVKDAIPYTDYEASNGHPFTVDYFDIGSYWNTDKAYTLEVGQVEDFIKERISQKKITNSVSSIREYMKDLELTSNVKPYDHISSKLAKIIDYIKTVGN